MAYLNDYDTFKNLKVSEQATGEGDIAGLKQKMETALTTKNNAQNALTLADKAYQEAQRQYNDALAASVNAQNQKAAAEAEAAKNIQPTA
jgi:hypothetical protein